MTSIVRIPRSRIAGIFLFVTLLLPLLFAIDSFGQRTQEERHEETLEKIRQAIELFNQGTEEALRKAHLRFREIIALPKEDVRDIGMGLSYFYAALSSAKLEKGAEATREYELAVVYLRAAKRHDTLAVALNNLALLISDRGRAVAFLQEAVDIWKQLGDKGQECNSLINLGAALRDTGDSILALTAANQATGICLETGNKSLSASSYYFLGGIYLSRNEMGKAVESLKKGLTLVREAKDISLEILILEILGQAYVRSGDDANAKIAFEHALSLARQSNNVSGTVSILIGLTTLSNRTSDFELAVKYGELGLEARKQSKLLPDHAEFLYVLSQSYTGKGEFAKAVASLREARELFRSANRLMDVARTFHAEGAVHEQAGNDREAVKAFQMAAETYKGLGDRDAHATSLEYLAGVFDRLGDLNNALALMDESVMIYRSLGSRDAESKALMAIGLIKFKAQLNIGNFDSARVEAQKVVELGLERKNGELEAAGLLFLARVSLAEYDFGVALKNLEKAEALLRSAGVQEALRTSLFSMGEMYTILGLYNKARELFERIPVLFPSSKATVIEANRLLYIGNTYMQQRDFPSAISYFEKARDTARLVRSRSTEALAINNIGVAFAEQKQNKKAIDYFEQTLRLIDSKRDIAQRGFAHVNLGWAYAELDGNPKAIGHLNQALAVATAIGAKELESFALGGYAAYWREQKNEQLAVFYGKQAINLIQSIRQSLRSLDYETQKAYIDKFSRYYREFADWLIGYGRIAEAEKVLAMLKEEEYYEFLRRDGRIADELLATLKLTPEEQKAFEEYKKFSADLTKLGKEFGELELERLQFEAGKFPKQHRLAELEGQLMKANIVFTAFLDQLKLRLGQKDVRVSLLDSGSQALLKELKEPKAVFVSTIVGENRLNVIVTTSEVQKAYSSPIKETDLNKLVADFRGALRSPRTDPRIAGKALYEVLFSKGLSKDLENVKAETIVWSLDGTLRYVPISALWDGEKYLVERFNNVLITLASRDKLNTSINDRGKWVALGVGVSKETTMKESDGNMRTFDALTSVPDELCTIVADRSEGSRCRSMIPNKPGAINGRAYLDEEFTLQTFKDSLGRFPVVHIASHFNLNPGNENDSYLLLGGGEERRLSLGSIRQGGTRFVGVDLLTLSACNTGMDAGNNSNGLEIEGFGALAQKSGAKSVLASLWAVADTSTRDLMVEFYSQLIGSPNMMKANALRNAQLKLLNGRNNASETPEWRKVNPTGGDTKNTTAVKPFPRDSSAPFAHPYYWSPFILIGNWR